MNNEIIFVICDNTYEAKQLYRGTIKMVKQELSLKYDYSAKEISAGEFTFKFISKYDFDNNRLKGTRPSSIMTKNQFITQIIGEKK